MKILFYYPVSQLKRFVPSEAIKGNDFFRRPCYDALRLASVVKQHHEFYYYDERIEEKPQFQPDIVVTNVPLHLNRYVSSMLDQNWTGGGSTKNKPITISYGLYPTLFPKQTNAFSKIAVRGDIVSAFETILKDVVKKQVKPCYESETPIHFDTYRSLEDKYGFSTFMSQLRTTYGCYCKPPFDDYCPEAAMYHSSRQWEIERVVREVARIRRKVIFILDDDFLIDVNFAMNILSRTWRFKKMWVIQTSGDLFNNRQILPDLRECGVRIIYLKHDWLGADLVKNIQSKDFGRQKSHEIHMIHSNRMIACCRMRLGFEGETESFYKQLTRFLNGIKVDLIEVEAQTPLPGTRSYAALEKQGLIASDLSMFDRWIPVVKLGQVKPQDLYNWMELLRDRFYSWDSIIRRNLWVSQKLGFYNTVFFYLIPNLSYRNNFLEKIGFPP